MLADKLNSAAVASAVGANEKGGSLDWCPIAECVRGVTLKHIPPSFVNKLCIAKTTLVVLPITLHFKNDTFFPLHTFSFKQKVAEPMLLMLHTDVWMECTFLLCALFFKSNFHLKKEAASHV
jgi:hypothetical protein